jgi:hypothetical protein
VAAPEEEEIEDLSDLAEKAEDSAVVEISQITELEWDDEEAATRIDPRVFGGPALSDKPPMDTLLSPPPASAPRAGPPVPKSRAPTLLGVAAAAPAAPGAPIAYAKTIEQPPPTPAPGRSAPQAPISPFMQVADPAPYPPAAAPAFPEEAFQEGVPPDFEAAAAARLAASPVAYAAAPAFPSFDAPAVEVGDDDIVASRSKSKGALLGILGGGAVALVVVGVVAYALFFSEKPGGVAIRTTIPGATVSVDGQPISGSPGFFVAQELSPGPHTFTLVAPGMAAPITQMIVVEPDRTIDAPVDLGAGVGGAVAMGGTAAPGFGTAAAGFTAAPGGPPATADPAATAAPALTAAPATAAPATAAPEPETAAPEKVARRTGRTGRTPRVVAKQQARQSGGGGRGGGFLTVQTTPWSAVSVDGRAIGNTPVRRHALSAGSHTVSMVNNELGVRHTQRVTITEGAEVRVIRTLSR